MVLRDSVLYGDWLGLARNQDRTFPPQYKKAQANLRRPEVAAARKQLLHDLQRAYEGGNIEEIRSANLAVRSWSEKNKDRELWTEAMDIDLKFTDRASA
jgi:hypothetical protein